MKLRHYHHVAIEALCAGASQAAAARAAGRDKSRMTRWLRDPDFQAALAEAEREGLGGAARRLRSLADSSVDVLKALLRDEDSRVRLQAAGLVWKYAAPSADALAGRDDVVVDARGVALSAELGFAPLEGSEKPEETQTGEDTGEAPSAAPGASSGEQRRLELVASGRDA